MNNRKAFTIVELLIVVTIIALLLGILLPSINMVRTKAKETAQKAQFATIDMALEAFKQDYGDYPPSGRFEGFSTTGLPYNGGQKLTEALLGWDLAGFHPKTVWRRDGLDASNDKYTYDPYRVDGTRTLTERKGPYLEAAKTPVFRLGTSSATANDGLYNSATNINFAAFNSTVPNYVICDVFGVKKLTDSNSTKTAGTPVLYYKADTSYKTFTCLPLKWPYSIYKYTDNIDLINLGILPKGIQSDGSNSHALAGNGGRNFCDAYKIVDTRVPIVSTGTSPGSWPNRPDTYLLISAGADHQFGTNDDILNF
jgi:prepilin-type N-terminal cleavage/methylation domain-containing protein